MYQYINVGIMHAFISQLNCGDTLPIKHAWCAETLSFYNTNLLLTGIFSSFTRAMPSKSTPFLLSAVTTEVFWKIYTFSRIGNIDIPKVILIIAGLKLSSHFHFCRSNSYCISRPRLKCCACARMHTTATLETRKM